MRKKTLVIPAMIGTLLSFAAAAALLHGVTGCATEPNCYGATSSIDECYACVGIQRVGTDSI
jgi:hypothetical protein